MMREKIRYVRDALRAVVYLTYDANLHDACHVLQIVSAMDSESLKDEYHKILDIRGARKTAIKGRNLIVHTDTIFMKVPGTRYVVNLGTFLIVFNGMGVRISRCRRKGSKTFPHPFVQRSGSFCLGDHSDEFQDLLKGGNIPAAIQLLLQFLETANNSSCWASTYWMGWKLDYTEWSRELQKVEKEKTRLNSRDARRYSKWKKSNYRKSRVKADLLRLYKSRAGNFRRKHTPKELLRRLSERGVGVRGGLAVLRVKADLVRFSPSGLVDVNSSDIILKMAAVNPDLVVTMAKLVGSFRFREAARLAAAFYRKGGD